MALRNQGLAGTNTTTGATRKAGQANHWKGLQGVDGLLNGENLVTSAAGGMGTGVAGDTTGQGSALDITGAGDAGIAGTDTTSTAGAYGGTTAGAGLVGTDYNKHNEMKAALADEMNGNNNYQTESQKSSAGADTETLAGEYRDMVTPETTNAYLEQGERPQVETRSVNAVALNAGTEGDGTVVDTTSTPPDKTIAPVGDKPDTPLNPGWHWMKTYVQQADGTIAQQWMPYYHAASNPLTAGGAPNPNYVGEGYTPSYADALAYWQGQDYLTHGQFTQEGDRLVGPHGSTLNLPDNQLDYFSITPDSGWAFSNPNSAYAGAAYQLDSEGNPIVPEWANTTSSDGTTTGSPPPPPPNRPSITPENWSDLFSAIGLSGDELDQFRSQFYTNLWNRITSNVNSYGPFGSNIYTMDPNTGQFSNITTLNPILQAAMANQQNTQRRAAQRAYELLGTNVFSNPFSLNLDAYGMPTAFDATAGENNPYTQAAYDKAMQMIEPQQQNEKDMLRSQLANQGISPDSEAGRRALDELNRRHTYQNDVAMNNAWQQGMTAQAQQYQQMMQNRGQAGTEQMTQHQQRWADLLNMTNMGQVYQQPGTAHAAGGNMISPDILGYRSNQDQLALMNRQRQDNNFWSGIGGIIGLAGLFG